MAGLALAGWTRHAAQSRSEDSDFFRRLKLAELLSVESHDPWWMVVPPAGRARVDIVPLLAKCFRLVSTFPNIAKQSQ